MRITRLHLLLGLLILGAGAGGYWWTQQTPHSEAPALRNPAPKPSAPSTPSTASTSTTPSASSPDERMARALIATVEGDYDRLRQRFGEVPDVSAPLRQAKVHQAEGHYDLALASARQAAAAIKTAEQTGEGVQDSYVVVRGDTLWRIARDHSPVKQGPGWVAIWKANKTTVKNFDRLEVGWNLQIPPKPEQYATAYWTPRVLAQARRRGGAVAQVAMHVPSVTPLMASHWPPPVPADLELALASPAALPADIVAALSGPVPADIAAALATQTTTVASAKKAPVHVVVVSSPDSPRLPGAMLASFSDRSWPASHYR